MTKKKKGKGKIRGKGPREKKMGTRPMSSEK
jgi:hypothetical protein